MLIVYHQSRQIFLIENKKFIKIFPQQIVLIWFQRIPKAGAPSFKLPIGGGGGPGGPGGGGGIAILKMDFL